MRPDEEDRSYIAQLAALIATACRKRFLSRSMRQTAVEIVSAARMLESQEVLENRNVQRNSSEMTDEEDTPQLSERQSAD